MQVFMEADPNAVKIHTFTRQDGGQLDIQASISTALLGRVSPKNISFIQLCLVFLIRRPFSNMDEKHHFFALRKFVNYFGSLNGLLNRFPTKFGIDVQMIFAMIRISFFFQVNSM